VSYEESLKKLIKYCVGHGKQELTPSDLTYKVLTMSQLDELQEKYSIEDVYPLSPMQEGMLFHSLLDENADNYFCQMNYRLKGQLNIKWVEKSFQFLVNRHGVLRTIFFNEWCNRPLQVVLTEIDSCFTYYDIRQEVMEKGGEVVIEQYRRSDRAKKFKLNEDRLIRVSVYRTGEDEFEFIWSFHHIIMDGWCISILISEFDAIYQGCLEGKDVNLPAFQPYSSYINWLEARDTEASLNYWRDYLAGYESLASIPSDRSASMAYKLGTKQLVFNREVTESLRKTCRENGVTLNTLLQCAWGILLAKYNNVKDVVFGAVVSGRPTELNGIETMVGLFINTIPVRIGYQDDDNVRDLLKRIQDAAVEKETHHYNSLSAIQSISALGTALIDHVMVFENYPIAQAIEGGFKNDKETFTVTDLVVFEQTNYNLLLLIEPGMEISIKFIYNSNRYEWQTIEMLTEHLSVVIEQFTQNRNVLIPEITI
ncbi:MAG: non-ribosomal peptide synthetase, partial [Marivirga sp.]|nr:non-ribosomal peptide synthetase [Marivirga sp.]